MISMGVINAPSEGNDNKSIIECDVLVGQRNRMVGCKQELGSIDKANSIRKLNIAGHLIASGQLLESCYCFFDDYFY